MEKHLLRMDKKLIFLITLLVLCLFGNASKAYSLDQQTRVTIQKQGVPLKQILEEIESQTNCSFLLRDSDINVNKEVSIDVKDKSIKETLNVLFADANVRYELKDNFIRVYSPQQSKKMTIKGVVTDAHGDPTIGASVVVKNTSLAVMCDLDGKFQIEASINDILVVSYIGFAPQEIKIEGDKELKIILRENVEFLEEVVVVGYGSQKKANLTGSVASVNMDEVLGNRPIVKVADALQGTVPGLLISSTGNNAGSSKSFQLRGAYSLGIKKSDGTYGDVIKPLILIDNVEGDLDLINPEDIESISVLKDAASAAIYGARAAGGVILVTTKRPKGASTFQLNYNNNFAFGKAMNLPKQAPLMNYLQAYSDAAGDQFWTMGPTPSVKKWMGYLAEYQANPSSIPTVGDGIYKDAEGAIYFLNEKDLVKNMLETSFQQTHNISATGGTEKIRYRLSGAFTDNDGILISDKDQFRRMNVSSFISADVTDWFTQEANFSYASSKNTLPSSALGGIYSTRLASFYPEGTMPEGIDQAGGTGLPFFTPANQVKWANTSKNLTDNPRIFLKSIVKPMKGLQVAFEYTFDKNIYDYSWYTGKVNYTTIQGGKDTTPTEDYLQKTKRYTDYNSINLYGTYERSFNQHNFSLMAGFNQESRYRETLEAFSYGQAVVEVPSLGAGTSTVKAIDSYDDYSLRSGFFRLNYNYQQRYLLEVNGRYDGSSKFPKKDRFGFFPSVSVGWNIVEEAFMASQRDWLGGLKLRGSYGKIGNQNITSYGYFSTMGVNNKYGQWLSDGAYLTAITSLPALVRQDYTWEKVATTNVGVDFSLLNNRLAGSFDWFQRNTDGMLAPGMQLPAVVGAAAPLQNTANMRTRGWEFSVNWRDRIEKVEYRIGLNLSDNTSVITKYDNNSSFLLSSFYKGQELGEIWGYEFDGFYSVDDFENTSSWKLKEGVASINGYNVRPGDVKFKNLRDDDNLGENVISAGDNTLDNPGDRKRIGNSTPRYLYGITLGANFKGFDINIFMQGTGKRDAWMANTLRFPLYSDFKFVPLYDGLDDYWKPVDRAAGDYTAVNPNPEYPRIYGDYGNQGSNFRQSDKYLSDASYFRIKNVTLSYLFPKSLSSKISLKQVKTFVSVENLATFSSLPKGIDPETLSWNYPSFRTISFGFNVTL